MASGVLRRHSGDRGEVGGGFKVRVIRLIRFGMSIYLVFTAICDGNNGQ